ncbi:hypothetical protein GGI42DRAFT_231402 [Trichoderma sp. SZMC 28013]
MHILSTALLATVPYLGSPPKLAHAVFSLGRILFLQPPPCPLFGPRASIATRGAAAKSRSKPISSCRGRRDKKANAMHAAGDSSLCVGTRAAAHWPPLVPGRFHDASLRPGSGLEKVPRPAVAFGGAWEVQVLIPQHPRIRAVVDLCFHLISSHLISSCLVPSLQGTDGEFASLGFHRLISVVLSCLVLSLAVLSSLACTRRIIASSLSSFSLLHQSSPIAQHPATKKPNSCTPGLQHSTAQDLFSFASSFHHILANKHVSPSYKSMQASPGPALPLILHPSFNLSPSSKLQSFFSVPTFYITEAFVLYQTKSQKKKT